KSFRVTILVWRQVAQTPRLLSLTPGFAALVLTMFLTCNTGKVEIVILRDARCLTAGSLVSPPRGPFAVGAVWVAATGLACRRRRALLSDTLEPRHGHTVRGSSDG